MIGSELKRHQSSRLPRLSQRVTCDDDNDSYVCVKKDILLPVTWDDVGNDDNDSYVCLCGWIKKTSRGVFPRQGKCRLVWLVWLVLSQKS